MTGSYGRVNIIGGVNGDLRSRKESICHKVRYLWFRGTLYKKIDCLCKPKLCGRSFRPNFESRSSPGERTAPHHRTNLRSLLELLRPEHTANARIRDKEQNHNLFEPFFRTRIAHIVLLGKRLRRKPCSSLPSWLGGEPYTDTRFSNAPIPSLQPFAMTGQ